MTIRALEDADAVVVPVRYDDDLLAPDQDKFESGIRRELLGALAFYQPERVTIVGKSRGTYALRLVCVEDFGLPDDTRLIWVTPVWRSDDAWQAATLDHFHCVAGKDRTGIVAALLLSVLGVPDASIVADYHRTDGAAARQRAWADAHDSDAVAEMEATPAWVLRAPGATMETFLRLARDAYGSIDQFLAHLGVHHETTAALRHRLLAP